jgi:hypothetical protein
MKTGLSSRGRAVVRVLGGIVRFSIANREGNDSERVRLDKGVGKGDRRG